MAWLNSPLGTHKCMTCLCFEAPARASTHSKQQVGWGWWVSGLGGWVGGWVGEIEAMEGLCSDTTVTIHT